MRNNYIEYENNGDKNKIPSVKEYPHKIKPYLKDNIADFFLGIELGYKYQ